MTVVLNEAALQILLESQEGPVGRFIERKAQQVTAQAQGNVRLYFAGAPSLEVDQDVGFQMEGSTAVVGIRDAGNKARRLARFQAEGKVNWLQEALEASRG